IRVDRHAVGMGRELTPEDEELLVGKRLPRLVEKNELGGAAGGQLPLDLSKPLVLDEEKDEKREGKEAHQPMRHPTRGLCSVQPRRAVSNSMTFSTICSTPSVGW